MATEQKPPADKPAGDGSKPPDKPSTDVDGTKPPADKPPRDGSKPPDKPSDKPPADADGTKPNALLPFEPVKLSVPLKRKLDDVEECAEYLLKRIRFKDADDADELEKARVPQVLSQKFCAQSRALCDNLATEYGASGLPERLVVMESELKEAIDAFIGESFYCMGMAFYRGI